MCRLALCCFAVHLFAGRWTIASAVLTKPLVPYFLLPPLTLPVQAIVLTILLHSKGSSIGHKPALLL